MYPFILLALLALAVAGILIYRALTHSRWFVRLLGGIVEPPPENDDEAIAHYQRERDRLDGLADQNKQRIDQSKTTIKRVKRERKR